MNQVTTEGFFEKIFAGQSGHTVLVTWSGGTFGKGAPVVEKWFELPRQLSDMTAYVKANSTKDVYFTPYLFSEHKRRKECAVWTRSVHADLDGCPPQSLRTVPSLLWETSPGRHQAIWLLGPQEAVQDVEELSHGVALAHKDAGCDQGGWDIGQLLRVPGSSHNKREPHLIAPAVAGPDYTLDGFVDHYEGIQAVQETYEGTAAREELPKLPKHIQERLDGTKDEGTDRSKATRVMTLLCAQWGLTDGQILSVLDRHPKTQSKVAQYPTRDWDTLFCNEIAKARREHPHSGDRCDDAGCPNAPEWMARKRLEHDVEEFELIDMEPFVPVSQPSAAAPVSKAAAVLEAAQAPRVAVLAGTPAMEDGWDFDLSGFENEPHLIQNLIEKGTTVWLVGPSGSYKSFIALSMAASIASGQDWYGRETSRGPVVYICSEGARNWKKRMAAYVKVHGKTEDAETLMMIPAPVQVGSKEWNALQGTLVGVRPSMIVVDTQAQCTTEYEENSNSEMSKVTNALTAMAQATGATVLTVHHTGHSNDGRAQRGRGASSVYGAADTELSVVPKEITDEFGTVEGRYVEVKVTKQKDMEMGPLVFLAPRKIVFTEFVDYYGDPLSSLVMDEYTPSEGGSQVMERGSSPEDHARRIIAAGITGDMGRPALTEAVRAKGLKIPLGKEPMARITKAYRALIAEQ